MSALSKPPDGIANMRQAAAIAVGALEMTKNYVRPGVTTGELDKLCHDFIVSQGGIPACVGYVGYEHATCISVNHVICHGIPGDKKLREGDLLNIDLVVHVNGWHADTSAMFVAGRPSVAASRLATVTQECLYLGILAVNPGRWLSDIGTAIQAHADRNGYSVVRDYCGHGIGTSMHEEPQVVHYGTSDRGIRLMPGMTFTIEPMINAGSRHCRVLPDGWTVVTKDRSLSAQWEHTILVTESGFEILTLRPSERAAWEAFAAAARR